MREYPKGRQNTPFFANRFIRLTAKVCVAQEIGQTAALLLVYVVQTEDSCYYRKPVRFWNEQLMSLLGLRSPKQLAAARDAAVNAGWLHYQRSGNRSIGEYWVVWPDEFADLPDTQLGEQQRIWGDNHSAYGMNSGMNSGTNSGLNAERIGDDLRKEKGHESGKPSIPIPVPIQNTPAFLAEVCIPDGIDKQKAIELLTTWYRHHETSKRPMLPNDPRLETIARDMRREGLSTIEARMSYAINRGKYSLLQLPEERASGNVSRRATENPEWLDVLRVCRQYPSNGSGDMEERRTRLPRDCYKAALRVGITRIANASEYDAKSLALQWQNNRQRIREGLDNE